jgi:hypothetical protein
MLLRCLTGKLELLTERDKEKVSSSSVDRQPTRGTRAPQSKARVAVAMDAFAFDIRLPSFAVAELSNISMPGLITSRNRNKYNTSTHHDASICCLITEGNPLSFPDNHDNKRFPSSSRSCANGSSCSMGHGHDDPAMPLPSGLSRTTIR